MARVPRVMVVDPDRESSIEVQKLLSSLGFAVAAGAGYGIEAYMVAREVQPDIMLMRFEEPLIRPIQSLARLSDGMPDLPVIAYATRTNLHVMRQAMVGGARDYLVEPLAPEEVETSVMRVLEKAERQGMRRRGELEEPVPHGTVITVFGAKGGIGKTTIASNLAVSLVMEAQQSVALVDMDTRFGDVAIMMDIPVERSIADLARNLDSVDRDTLSEYLVAHESGVHVLPAPTRPSDWRNLGPAHIHEVVDVLAQTHDFVILDTPGTFNDVVATALELGTVILLVTTLDMASIKDTVLALEMLSDRFGGDEERIKVVLNRSGVDTGVRERDVEHTLDAELWWRIPQDHEVVKASQLGRPITMIRPKSKVSLEIREMACALAGIRGRTSKKSGGGGVKLLPFLRKSA
jgi:pilus assembly protein CpaE